MKKSIFGIKNQEKMIKIDKQIIKKNAKEIDNSPDARGFFFTFSGCFLSSEMSFISFIM